MQNAIHTSRTPQAASLDTGRSARLGLRSSQAQLAMLRRAAGVAHKSLTDFILDSACLAAEQTLLGAWAAEGVAAKIGPSDGIVFDDFAAEYLDIWREIGEK